MRTDEYVELSYKYGIEQIKENGESWREFLRLNGRIYQFEFNNIVVIYNQNKNASLLASYDSWNKAGRYVNKGTSAIKIFPSRVFTNRANIRHLFDISQTSGREVANNWVMTDDIKKEFVKYYALDDSNIDYSLTTFTSIIIGDILTNRYEEEFAQYPASTRDFISKSISYLVLNRCRLIDEANFDFSSVSSYNSNIISRIGDIVNNVSQEVLHDIYEDICVIIDNNKKERDNYGQGIQNGVQVRRGRTWLLNSGNSGRGTNELSNQPLRDRMGGLDGGDLSSGLRRVEDVSGVKIESDNGRGINQSEGRDNAFKTSDAQEERNGQDSGLYETSAAGELRKRSSGRDSSQGDNSSKENVSNLDRAKQLINEYSLKEFGSLADFSDLTNVDLGYTTITDEESGIEYDYEVVADLERFSIDSFVNGDEMHSVQYGSLAELIDEELALLDFDQLVSVPDEVWDRLREIEIDNETAKALNEYDEEFGADGRRVFPHLNDDKEVVEKTTSSFSAYNSLEEINTLHKGDQIVDYNGDIYIVQDDVVLKNGPYVYLNATKEKNEKYNIEYYDEPDYADYCDMREIRFANGGVYYLSDDEIADLEGIKALNSFKLAGRTGYKDNIDGYNYVELMNSVNSYISGVISEYAPELNVIDFALNGSRSRGYYDEYSDLDVVVFFKAPDDKYIREDYLFDLLHGVRGNFEEEDEEQLTINGITVDINPVIVNNYAEIGEYIESAEKFMEEEATKRKRSQESFSVLGLQSSKGFNNLAFNSIIHQSRNTTSEISVSEEIAEVIDLSFEEQVDKSLAGDLPFYTAIKVCDTPDILLNVGCEQLPILYSQKHLKKAVLPKNAKEHTHGLQVEQIKLLPDLLSDPVMIADSLSQPDSIVIITNEMDEDNNPILISLKPNGQGRYELEEIDSNFITSVYGRNNFVSFFERLKDNDNLLFCNKIKTQQLFERWGEQYSELTNALVFDSIIHQSRNITSEKSVSEEIAEVIDKTKIDEIADTSEPAASETYKQASLFDADFWMGYATSGENIAPAVDFTSNILSEEGINEILKTDGRNRGGRLDIYEKYRENLTPEEMADFLRKEYGNIAKGFTINGVQISMVSDKNGITFGNGISARDNFLKRLSWEEVEKRTRNLVETGSFLNESEIELVDEHTREKFAEWLEYEFRDLEEPYPPSILSEHQPGFPDNANIIAEKLKSKDFIRTVLSELKKIEEGVYTPRFKGLSKHHLAFLVPNLSFYLRDKVEYLTRNDVILIDETFVSQETLDIGLKHGSGFSGGKLRIEEWFRDNHSVKENVDFLKKEYGIGVGTSWAGDGVYDDHDSRGITVTIGQLLGENIKVKYGYNEVAKRLKHLVSKGEYLSESQKKEYDNKMAARAAFLDGLEEGNIYRLNDSTSILDGEFEWITEIDWDTQTFKAIGIYLNDDFTFNIEDNEHTYRHLYSYDFKHFPDYNYEFVKNARDLGGLDLVHFVSETYPSDNDWIVKLSDGIKKDVVDNDILDNIVDEVNIVKESADDITDDFIVEDAERINYRIDLNDLPESVGPKARFRRNIDAIKTLKIIEGENRLATAEEQKIMSLYVGWGGLSEAFDESNTNWASEYLELKKLLNDTEYSSARASVNTAFYTDPRVINAVSEAVKNMGFKGGNILEPSCAIGNFFGTLDEDILNNSNVYGVEIDDVSGRIARQLYQKVDISICGYEDTDFSDNFFDLAIGNVPFGQYKVYDKDYRDLNFNIHDYFFAKTLDKVRPGGIVAFITTIGTLDKKSDVVRKYIGERAELLGAIRLPDITFKDFAGTKASSDIIFLKKRDHRTIEEPDWLDILPNSDNILVNRYFIENPDMMLGKMVTDNRFGDRKFTSCTFDGDTNQLYDRLNDTITNLPTDIYAEYKVLSEDNTVADTIPADPEVRNYTYTVIDDEIYFRTNSVMTKQDFKGRDKDRVKACIFISDYVRKVMNMQLNGCSDEELKVALEGLNEAYDKFVKEYGYFHDRKNHSIFQDDDSYNILEALEMENEDSKTFQKSPFFSRRTIKNAETVQSVDNAVDALNCSINDFGRVELPYMASIYDKPIEQIRKEMLERGIPSSDLDYETDEEIKMHYIIDELKGVIYMNPMSYDENNIYVGWETADEYLSGNVRSKLLIAKEAAEQNPDLFNINVSSLAEVIPEWIDATNIEVRLGTTWIDTSDYEAFIYDKFEIPYRLQRIEEGSYWNNNNNKVIIEKDDINGSFYISNKSSVWSEKVRTTYGTDRLNALEIFERLLNLKIVTVYDTYEENGKKKRVINNKETMLARDKAEVIKQEFIDWIFVDPDRREKYEKFYNENFNNTHLREYNGDYLTFPGMTPTIELRPHQKNAVSHILLGGNTLLAHAVGAGKSFEMFAAVMEQRRLGLANKPVIVVPKSIINQTANEFMRLYPTANLLVANTKNFAKKDRMRFLSRASTGDYDCIIMSHEQFKEIPISKERMLTLLNREYDLYSEMLENLAETDRKNGGKKWTIKRMEKEKQNIETKIKKIEDEIAEGKIDLFTFEETGIDSIFVDEAHNYKNRGIFTKMSNISGISTTDSKQAMDMYFKTQYLNEKHSGRGVVFATGTPISNSMCEMYVMQTYLQNDRLIDRGVAAFDNWATSFGEVTQSLDLSVEGNGYRLRNKFNKFVNVPELLTMFHEFADVQTAEMLKLPDVPTMRGGKAIIVESQVDDFTKMYMDSIVERAEALRNKQVSDPRVDNFLKITSEARLLGTDARLLDGSAPDNPDGKLNKAADNIYKEYKDAEEKGIIGTQLVFSDIGTPSPNKFNVYDELKAKLVEKGIPEEEIAFIHDAKTDVQRQKLFDNTQSGKIKVLFGSTSKLGTGVNVQHHLVALHHLDCPWRPSDIEQREGRGLRQGNVNDEVAIYRYVTVGTFDAYLWSVVENKQKFINQVMKGSITDRNMADIDETELGFAEIKAVASGNPKIKRKMELDMELNKLNMLKNAWTKNKYSLQDKFMKEYPREITRYKEQIEHLKADIVTRDKELEKNPDFEITICGTGETFTERKAAGQKILELARSVKTDGEKRFVAKYKGFEVYAEARTTGIGLNRYLVIKGESSSRTDNFSSDYVGIITQIENKVKGLEKRLENTEFNLELAVKNKEQAEIEYKKLFEHEEHLAAVKKELTEINTELDLDNVKDDQTFAIDENGSIPDSNDEPNKNKTL